MNWLTFKLESSDGSVGWIGSRVRVVTGDVTQLREIRAGSNFASQSPPEAHFGLGTWAMADLVEVEWPSGATTRFTNVDANQLILVSPLFRDGFESGDTSQWSASSGTPR